ncbi:MarR family winged helix-turn-helix transcriptional regulator [Amycolatopsis sacchari]|uniref:DNA-binding transcriptional regulator, MarR family n=1 Tax=Amycolatopsis sacchari TaxID=115433 RepID=A0A1I3RG08_9PSEU|nr:MarR family transcriptional regulator [Amycolatopsis sacchari]SFJ44281.1 DNA-binding transcriptional regulator, MarR family [Amycolatopsis sacchari]
MAKLAQVFADLVRFETRLYNAVDDRLRAEHGLSAGQYEFLKIIADRADCRVQDLAREVAITVGATSKGVDRLEARGWVSRRPNPANRRSSLLGLTEEGRKLLDTATETFEDELSTWLDEPLTARSLDQFAATLARLRRTVEDAGVGLPRG